MHRTIKPLAVALVTSTLVLAGCSDSADGGAAGDNIIDAIAITTFDGEFQSECLPGPEANISVQDQLIINGAEASLTQTEFSSPGCGAFEDSTELGTVVVQIDIVYGDTLIFPATGFSGQEADLIFGAITLTPATADRAESFNTADTCGITSFEAGVAAPIPSDCENFSSMTGTSFNTLALENNELFLGSPFIFQPPRSPDDRPNELDVFFPLVRVP